MGKKMGIVGGLLILSSLVSAGQLSVKVENKVIQAKVCNLPQGVKDVYFQVGQKGFAKNGIEQRENSIQGNCALKTYNNASNDLFLKGGEVVASYMKEGRKVVMTEDIAPTPTPTPRPGTDPVTPRPQPVPQPQPTPQPQPQPQPVPQKKTTPDDKVRNYGEQAANFMANRVVETYGRVENYRFNFYQGFRKQANLYSNLGIAVENLPEYHQGYQSGHAQGTNEGYQNGLAEGSRVGQSLGQAQARARFESALGNQASLNVAPGAQPTGNDFAGLSPSVSDPDFGSMLSDYNREFLDEARMGLGLGSDLEDDILNDVYGNYWNLSDYYRWNNYQYDTVFSNWKAENAFNLFLSRKLVRENSDPGKVQANNQMVTKYREITNADEYEDAEQSRQQFRGEFVSQYNSVIGRKWNSEVYGRPNPGAQMRGEYYFVLALKAYAQKLGRSRGYATTYGPSSQQGFQKSVGAAYKSAFDQTVNHYMNNPVIENVRVQLFNQSGLNTLSILDSVYPTVAQATNLGKANGSVQVTLSGKNLNALPAGSTIAMDVPGLSQVTTAKMLNTPAQVAQNAKANQPISIDIRIQAGGQVYTQTQQLMVSWSQTIKQMGAEPNASREAILAQYLAAQLLQEWKDFGLFDGNPYEKKPMETLAGQYVQMVEALPADQQAKLKKYNQALTAGYGKKPFLFSGKWKSVEMLFKKIGYKMP